MLYLGQMSGLCFAAYAIGLTLLPRHPRAAGCCLAIMVTKPNLALIALPALIAAPSAAGVTFVLAALLWPIGSLLVSGPATLVDFLLRVYAVRDTTLGLVSSSLGSLLPLEGTPHAVVQFALLGALLGMMAWLWWRRWRGMAFLTDGAVDFAAVMTLAALPYALVSDLLFALPLLLRCAALRCLVVAHPCCWPPGGSCRGLPQYWRMRAGAASQHCCRPWLPSPSGAGSGRDAYSARLPCRLQRLQVANHRTGDLRLGGSAGGDTNLLGAVKPGWVDLLEIIDAIRRFPRPIAHGVDQPVGVGAPVIADDDDDIA